MPELSEPDRKLWGMFVHLAGLAGFIGVPFGNILGPLIVWLIKRNESAFVDEQGKEAINFHISLIIYAIVAGVLCLVLVGFALLAIIYVAGIILTIVAAVKANNGESYRYPLTIRLLT